MEVQNGARNFRTTGNFRGHFADQQKTQNAAGNWPFSPNFDPFWSTSRQILGRWKFKRTENSRIPRIPINFAESFANRRSPGYPKYDWELAISRSIPRHFDHFPYNLHPVEIKIALELRRAPETFGSLSNIYQKPKIRLEIGHFYPIPTHFAYLQANIDPLEIQKSAENSRFPRTPSFFELSADFRLLRKSAHSWISEIRLKIGYFGSISRHF